MALETVDIVLDQTWRLISNAGAGRFRAVVKEGIDALFSIGTAAPDAGSLLGTPAKAMNFDALDGRVWARGAGIRAVLSVTRVVDAGNPALIVLPDIGLSATTFSTALAAGGDIATITNRIAGDVIEGISLNDGRLVLSTDKTKLVRGMTDAAPGAIRVEIVTSHPLAANSPKRQTFTIGVTAPALAISGTPEAATVGKFYGFVPSVTGGYGTKSFSLTGSLPEGLSFSSSTGAITGHPRAAGTLNFSVAVSDVTGTANLAGKSITIAGSGGGGGGGTSRLYMAAGNRVMTNGDTSFAVGANIVRAFTQFLGIAGWEGDSPRAIIKNAKNTNGRIGYITNGFRIRKAGYMWVPPDAAISANGLITPGPTPIQFQPVTFGGQQAVDIPAGTTPSSVVSTHDELPATVKCPAGWRMFWQEVRQYAATTDVFVPLVMTSSAFSNMGGFGERFMQSATVDALDVEVGRVFSGSAGPTGGPCGVNGFFMKGAPEAILKDINLLDTDSIGQGGNGAMFSNNSLVFANTDGEAIGGIKMALNSSAGGGRKFYWDIGTFASGIEKGSPVVYPENHATPSWHWTVKAAIALLGNVPFKHFASQQGHNDTNIGFAGMKVRLADLVTWLKANYQIGRVVWFGCMAYNTQANNSFWTNEADQTPSAGTVGAATDFNAWLAAGADGNVNAFIPSHTVLQNGLKFKEAGLYSGTLLAATTANTSPTITVSNPPPEVGSLVIIEPGAANFDRGGYVVKSITANPTLGGSDLLINQQNGFARNIQLAHSIGAPVKEAYVVDEEHYSARAHRVLRDAIVSTWKAGAFV